MSTRFKLIGYSRERSWTNGLCWEAWVISWLRSHGVTAEIAFTVDNGEEFGAPIWIGVVEDDIIRYVQPIILDDVAVKLGPWSGYNVLAHCQLYRQS